MELHTPTLLLVNLTIAAAMAVSMGLVARRAWRDGMVYWAWGMAMLMLAYLLLSLRGLIHDALSVVVGNTLLGATFALFAEGLCQFQDRRPLRVLIWGPVLLMLLAMTLLLDQQLARTLLATLVLAFQSVMLLQLLMIRRHETVGRGQYFVVAGLVLVILAFLARLAMIALGQTDLTGVTDSSPVYAVSVLASTVTIVLVAMGLVMMTKERADTLNRTLALQDELTGLHNRRSIQKLLSQQLAMSSRSARPLALLLIDIDHFKRINDSHGHLSGDKALREVAACLQERLRAQDIVGRWGGEEFIAILPDTGAAGAGLLAEQLRRAVEQLQVQSLVGKHMPLTISIGLHVPQAPDPGGSDEMVSTADRALYLAKQNGRNRVEAL
jgi:diguanylate cyclase (GGDEF)-like protein